MLNSKTRGGARLRILGIRATKSAKEISCASKKFAYTIAQLSAQLKHVAYHSAKSCENELQNRSEKRGTVK